MHPWKAKPSLNETGNRPCRRDYSPITEPTLRTGFHPMNYSETFAPSVVAIVSKCAIHPADFLREVGKADKLTDGAAKVGVSAGAAIRGIVAGRFAKGTSRSVIDAETARWSALSALSAVAGVRLAALLAKAGVNTGDANSPAIPTPAPAPATQA